MLRAIVAFLHTMTHFFDSFIILQFFFAIKKPINLRMAALIRSEFAADFDFERIAIWVYFLISKISNIITLSRTAIVSLSAAISA
jgi:hypothetical protein